MKSKKINVKNIIFSILIIFYIFSMSDCKKYIGNINFDSESKPIADIPIKEINSKQFIYRNIESKYKKILYYEGQDSYEMEEIAVPLNRLIDPKQSIDENSIIITNYTPISIGNFTINLKISTDTEVTLFKLDSLIAFSSLEIKYSDIFNNVSNLYSKNTEEIDVEYVKNNIKFLAKGSSLILGWDKGNNEFLDRISTIKAQWISRIRDYGRAYSDRDGVCDDEYAVITPNLARLCQALVINMAYLFSQDDFMEFYLKCYLNNNQKRRLSRIEKEYGIKRLLSYTNYRFGIFPGGGGVGNVGSDGFHIFNLNDVKEVFESPRTRKMIEKNVVYDPVLYPDKVLLKVDSLGGEYLINNNYEGEYSWFATAHEFGHNIGYGHSSSYTYGNYKVINKEFDNKGVLKDVAYYSHFCAIVGIMTYKYESRKLFPVRKDNYFNKNDIESLKIRPYTYCELNGITSRSVSNDNIPPKCLRGCKGYEHNH